MIDRQAIVQQNLIETGALSLLADSIRSAITWPLPRRQPGRKVATVRYLCQLYRQLFERVLAAEENDGYMDLARETDPRFDDKLERCLREHQAYRAEWQEIMPRLDRMVATNDLEIEILCDQISELLNQIDRHLQRESDLLAMSSLLDFDDENR